VLEAEVRRLLASRKASALVQNFATQWLQIRELPSHRADRKRFPRFDDELRAAMGKETEMFFEAVMREDLSVLTLLDADFTFLNERLARHYGIEGVEGPQFRKVALEGGVRGGVLTQASVLTMTSNPPAPRRSSAGAGCWSSCWARRRPRRRRACPSSRSAPRAIPPRRCASASSSTAPTPPAPVCHKKMDPLGFGLENFDAVGAWRAQEDEAPVDATGVLPGGQTFTGPAQLKAVLKGRQKQFRRSLVTKLFTYALGRGPEPGDRPAIDDICAEVAAKGDRFSALILGIANSEPFRKRRGPEAVK
jgi:hypothetical protein